MADFIKIVLVSFGSPAETNREIQGEKLSEIIKNEPRYCSCEVRRLPTVGERFIVKADSYEGKIFICVKIESELNSIDGYEGIVIGNFVHRLAFEQDANERKKLESFIK